MRFEFSTFSQSLPLFPLGKILKSHVSKKSSFKKSYLGVQGELVLAYPNQYALLLCDKGFIFMF